ncbi:MAG TPA: TraR/DksA C4-type zinc finger protein [Candidatus Brocadiia bacterium]|nr:TraR/DksA C4-type zinc finger protein [Candidatus Brocadiia bacterium]
MGQTKRESGDTAKNHLNRTDLDKYKKVLVDLRSKLAGNVNYMEDEALGKSRQSASGDLSNVPIHMADIGTDSFEQDLMIELIENGEAELRDIDVAIALIEKGSYGLCEDCGKPIPKARLNAIPYARLCLDCKSREERETGN